MTLTPHTALLVDAVATAATAALMLAARGLLYPFFGLTSPLLLDAAAAAFLVYAAIVATAARQPTISRATLMTVAGANVAYVVASIALLTMFWWEMQAIGRGLIVAVAIVVEAFAALQFTAARRLTSWQATQRTPART